MDADDADGQYQQDGGGGGGDEDAGHGQYMTELLANTPMYL